MPTPVNIAQTVGRLEGAVQSLEAGQTEMKVILAGQDEKLDKLLEYHNRRKGARALTKATFSLLASGGLIGWLWEHFHK